MLQGLLGLILIPLLAWLISENRQAFNWRVPLTGLLLQLIIALLLLKFAPFQALFIQLNQILLVVQQATEAGTSFVFGYLGGAESPYLESDSGSSFILAFRALPLVLVISALSALLFYWRLLPLVLNELLAYLDLARLPAHALSERSRLIVTYALCGFANFGSLGIMIGRLGSIIPERRNEIVALGMKSIGAGTVAGLVW